MIRFSLNHMYDLTKEDRILNRETPLIPPNNPNYPVAHHTSDHLLGSRKAESVSVAPPEAKTQSTPVEVAALVAQPVRVCASYTYIDAHLFCT